MNKGSLINFSIIPKDDPKQALRIRRFLMAFGAYVICGFLCYFAYLAGFVETVAFYGWLFSAITINIILYIIFRTGLNLKMADPSLTAIQMCVAITYVMFVMYFANETRPVLLLIYVVILLFGIFRLNTRGFLYVSLFTLLTYGVVIAQLHIFRPQGVNFQMEYLQWVVLAGVLLLFSIIGGYISRLRTKISKDRSTIQRLTDNVQDVIFVLDMNLNFTYVSPSVKILSWYEPEEVLKQTLSDAFASSSMDAATKAISEIMALEKTEHKDDISRTLQLEVKRKGGTTVWTETTFTFIRDESQRPLEILAVMRDITDRKKIEEKLRSEEHRFRALSEQSSDIIVLVNRKGIITYENPEIERVLGFKAEERIGTNVFDLIHPDELKNVIEVANTSIGGINAPILKSEVRLRHRDGSWRTFEVTASSLMNETVIKGGIINLRDITRRKQMEEELRQGKEKYQSILENIQEAYFEVDLTGKFTFFNDSLCRMTGYTQEELFGANYTRFSDKETSKNVFQAFNKVYKTGESTERFDWLIIRKDSTKRYIEASVSLQKDSSGNPIGFKGMIHDITERKRIEQELSHMATHDVLTGLPNRLMFSQLLNHAIQSARRHQRQFAVLFIDLDRFKMVNDTMGHEAGDQLLQEVARRFKQSLRTADVVGRLGGDEFIMLIEEVSDLSQVATVAQKILTTAIKPIVILGEECRVTASIGISMYPRDGENEQSLMKNADTAMYFAKEEGKNNYQFYSKDIQSRSNDHLSLETSLCLALEREEFYLQYQAKVDFKTGMITGVEALLRWQNPSLGLITPTQFLPVAEETGLIVPVGRWVMKTVCAQNAAWQRQGLPPVCVAVNLSLRQLTDDNLLKDIKSALNDSGIAPNLLELEITESMVMHNPARLIAVLTEIKKIGVRLAIDNFGTGYSSLAQIKHYPIDTLKVDRSFIRNIPRDSEDKAVIESIINMGKHLSLTVVAEGVETQVQDDFLREHICDEMQGFHFSKPVAPDQFADLLRKHNTYSQNRKKC